MARNRGRRSGGRSIAEQARGVELAAAYGARHRARPRRCRPTSPGREVAQQPRDLARDAGAHQHVVDAGEHRAVRGRRRGHLHLLQVVDADRPVVALLGQPHLDEVADDGELLARPGSWRSVSLGIGGTACRRRGRPSTEVACRAPASASAGHGELRPARGGTSPSGSPSCSRRASTVSSAVPDTTPSCPARDTARASRQRRHGHAHAALDDHGSRGLGHGHGHGGSLPINLRFVGYGSVASAAPRTDVTAPRDRSGGIVAARSTLRKSDVGWAGRDSAATRVCRSGRGSVSCSGFIRTLRRIRPPRRRLTPGGGRRSASAVDPQRREEDRVVGSRHARVEHAADAASIADSARPRSGK